MTNIFRFVIIAAICAASYGLLSSGLESLTNGINIDARIQLIEG